MLWEISSPIMTRLRFDHFVYRFSDESGLGGSRLRVCVEEFLLIVVEADSDSSGYERLGTWL
jgi:hypothetical protein